MKRLILTLFVFPISAFGQTGNPPDCSQSLTLTTVTAGTPLPTISGSGNGCVGFRLTWYSTGFTGYTIGLQGSQDNSTWANIGSTYVQEGTNPTSWTSSTGSNTIVVRAYFPYIRVNISSVTGSGVIHSTLYGYKGTSAQLDLGGGSGGSVSISASSPIVVTPNPITGTGTISCPTCNTSSPISGLTTNAIVTAASSSTIQTPSATSTMDSSGNISTPGSVTTGNGSSTTGAIDLKGKTSGHTVTLTVGDSTAAGTVTVPGVTGTAVYVASAGTSGHCTEFATDGIGLIDAGAACGSGGGGGSLNPSCTFSTSATGCTINTSSLNVASANYNSIITQCWTGASTTQTAVATLTYVYTTGSGIVQSVAPTFASAAAAGYCTANAGGGGGGGGGGTVYALGSLTAPPTTGWTSENLCSGTWAATTQGFWQLTGAHCGSISLIGNYRTAPSTPFTIDIVATNDDALPGATFFLAPALGVRDSGGKYVTFALGSTFSGSNIGYANTEIWNSATSRASAPSTYGPTNSDGMAHAYQNPVYWRMTVTSTTITFFISTNFGVSYQQFGSPITISGNLADTSFVEFGYQNEGSGARGTTLISYLAH